MSSAMTVEVENVAKKLAEKMDQRLIDFFGSEEAIRAYGNMYVLEETDTRMETYLQPEFTGDYFSVRTETKYRIRPKTLAELEATERD
jgi:hypothetical protein